MFGSIVYKNRRKSLITNLKEGVVLFLGNSDVPMNYPANGFHFRQDSSFLYFFGLNQPGKAAILDIDTGEEILFGDDYDLDDVIWMGPQPTMNEFGEKCGIYKVMKFSKLEQVLSENIAKGRFIHYLPPYRAENKLILFNLLGIKPEFLKSYSSKELIRAIVSIRSIKSEEEIAEIEYSHSIAYQMHTWAMRNAKPGMYEREIAGMVEGIALQNGGQVSFPVICSKRGETLHNHNHSNRLEDGDLLLLDAGFESELSYASDITRVIPVGGKFSQRQKDIYNIVLNANNRVLEIARPNITYQSVHLDVSRIIAQGLKDLGLMKGDVDEAVSVGAHALFFPHGLGHMMGLDVHDMEDYGEDFVGYDAEVTRINQFGTAYLRLGRKLKPGFVVTDEPGIYFIPSLIDLWKAEKKFENFLNYENIEAFRDFGGIRLEDDLLITNDGCRLIGNQRVPISVLDVENMHNKI